LVAAAHQVRQVFLVALHALPDGVGCRAARSTRGTWSKWEVCGCECVRGSVPCCLERGVQRQFFVRYTTNSPFQHKMALVAVTNVDVLNNVSEHPNPSLLGHMALLRARCSAHHGLCADVCPPHPPHHMVIRRVLGRDAFFFGQRSSQPASFTAVGHPPATTHTRSS
jgi:hypothetical protein